MDPINQTPIPAATTDTTSMPLTGGMPTSVPQPMADVPAPPAPVTPNPIAPVVPVEPVPATPVANPMGDTGGSVAQSPVLPTTLGV